MSQRHPQPHAHETLDLLGAQHAQLKALEGLRAEWEASINLIKQAVKDEPECQTEEAISVGEAVRRVVERLRKERDETRERVQHLERMLTTSDADGKQLFAEVSRLKQVAESSNGGVPCQ